MTEEVIIDGVNVTGCKDFLEPNGCDNNDCISFQCDRNYNCQYKQLQRLKQENEELKNKIDKFRWDNPYFELYNNVVFQRDKLEQENEALRGQCNKCKQYEIELNNRRLLDENEELKEKVK